MRYCARCVTAETRPNITFNHEGVCNACEAHTTRRGIDWAEREKAFRSVAEESKRQGQPYDCVIPVSGGKDSTWQAVKCLETGLHPLAVTWKTPGRTRIGQQNLDNLVRLGVDHIDFQINPKVERKFMVKALSRFGSTAVPMHMALFNIPLSVAVKFDIPLVVWGENSAFEYGGTEEDRKGFRLDRSWLKKYGVTHGTTAQDWVSEDLTTADLTPYFGPSDEELEVKGIRAVFLGCYFPWDPATSLAVARTHGFRAREEGPKTGYWNYADIDDDFISIHHYIKWYKFGFTRLFDNLSIEIRHGRMSRDQAVQIIRERGDQTPWEDINAFCSFTGMARDRFFEIIETFRNRDVWTKKNGVWTINDFLIPDWKWEQTSSPAASGGGPREIPGLRLPGMTA